MLNIPLPREKKKAYEARLGYRAGVLVLQEGGPVGIIFYFY